MAGSGRLGSVDRMGWILAIGVVLSMRAGVARAAPQPPVSPVILNESVDDSSLTVTWQKPSAYSSITSYRVYVNGTLKCTTSNGPTNKPRLYCHVGGLAAGTYYDGGTSTPQGGAVQVASVDGTGESTRVTALASSKTSGSRCACTTSPCGAWTLPEWICCWSAWRM